LAGFDGYMAIANSHMVVLLIVFFCTFGGAVAGLLIRTILPPHHFNDVQQFVNECARVLKAGGLLGIADNIAPEDAADAAYIDDFEKLRDPSHARCLPTKRFSLSISFLLRGKK
jgi:SAM-dependent methyltransferase